MKVALNGFGRIGRDVVRQIFEYDVKEFELVAVNDLGDVESAARLFKHDSLYGRFDGTIEVKDGNLVIDGKEVKFFSERDPENLPWKELGVEIVIDSTGVFRDKAGASKHIKAGAKKVIITAPAKDPDVTIVMGVNDDKYDPEKHNIISDASCTTNCLAPVTKVLLEEFGVKRGLMTTIHSYTNDQNIHDNKHKKDPRRARAAALSMIPTTTGAAKAVAEVLPEVKGKMTGYAVRVPTPTVSLVDLTVELEKEASVEEINAAMKKASEGELKGILGYEEDPLVSIDYQGDKRSSIFDPALTLTMGNLAKVVAWYDNEWGYSNTVVKLTKLVATK